MNNAKSSCCSSKWSRFEIGNFSCCVLGIIMFCLGRLYGVDKLTIEALCMHNTDKTESTYNKIVFITYTIVLT